MRRNRTSWNLQLVRIHSKGMEAHKAGVPLDGNPYDNGARRGNLQRQRARYWADGWKTAAGLGGYGAKR